MTRLLTRQDLLPLEQYAEQRAAIRERIMAHKARRRIALGEHLTLYFESRETIRYQVQEMLRIERIFEAAAIEEELAAYNPLIPGAGNLKATLMIEYADVAERRRALRDLVGVEDQIWLQVNDGDKVFGIADEDLDRATADKTSAVHFLRFPLPGHAVQALLGNGEMRAGCDHPAMTIAVLLAPDATRELASDLE